jgi:hypothetical protein
MNYANRSNESSPPKRNAGKALIAALLVSAIGAGGYYFYSQKIEAGKVELVQNYLEQNVKPALAKEDFTLEYESVASSGVTGVEVKNPKLMASGSSEYFTTKSMILKPESANHYIAELPYALKFVRGSEKLILAYNEPLVFEYKTKSGTDGIESLNVQVPTELMFREKGDETKKAEIKNGSKPKKYKVVNSEKPVINWVKMENDLSNVRVDGKKTEVFSIYQGGKTSKSAELAGFTYDLKNIETATGKFDARNVYSVQNIVFYDDKSGEAKPVNQELPLSFNSDITIKSGDSEQSAPQGETSAPVTAGGNAMQPFSALVENFDVSFAGKAGLKVKGEISFEPQEQFPFGEILATVYGLKTLPDVMKLSTLSEEEKARFQSETDFVISQLAKYGSVDAETGDVALSLSRQKGGEAMLGTTPISVIMMEYMAGAMQGK